MGLTGRVNNHWWRLFGAIFIGGALRGGTQAMTMAMSDAAGAGQMASGYGSVINQASEPTARTGPDTRPTIEVDAGQICNVLLTQPLVIFQPCGNNAHDGKGDTMHHVLCIFTLALGLLLTWLC